MNCSEDIKSVPETATLRTSDMDVVIRRRFPSVVRYVLGDRALPGQPSDVRDVTINDVTVPLGDDDVAFAQCGDARAEYRLVARNRDAHIDAELTVAISVEARALHFDIVEIVNHEDESRYPIQTVAFPDHSLVSVRGDQPEAVLVGAVMSCDVMKTGDETLRVESGLALTDRDYTYAFVSDGILSAGLWSNSEHDGRVVAVSADGGSRNTRVYATSKTVDGVVSLGLASAPWYYHRKVSDSHGRVSVVEQIEMPRAAVVIADDVNGDGRVDWQDAAIEYRSVMNNPVGAQNVPDLVCERIAMNFGSQVQNPFLTTLDNVKKVALATDGLGQSVMLKGYANEGHDSSHPDYADINQRAGGIKDLRTLMEDGRKYGARFGIHINVSEMYPEADALCEDMVHRKDDGRLHYGWNWIDQGIGLDAVYDLVSGNRARRLNDLKQAVGDGLEFVYVDIWGNHASSDWEDSWQTRRMSRQLNDNGWRVGTEYGSSNEYDATMQHWAVDLGYNYSGGSGKGENSQIMRFLRNHQKDSWVGDYPAYGGAADSPLLGGYDMRDFEGWQGRNDFKAYIVNIFTHDLTTKFIQHFRVMRWVNSPLDGNMPCDPVTNGGHEQIRLADGDGHTLVLSRGSNDPSDPAYRQRSMELDGRVIAHGSVSRGDGTGTGDEAYLISWLWDAVSGDRVAPTAVRLYHWNTAGGSSVWELPADWQGQDAVAVYQLGEQGRGEQVIVPVVDGRITLDAAPETAYVIYRCDALPEERTMQWSTGTHLVDVGFNGGEKSLAEHWPAKGPGVASIVHSEAANPMLRLEGDVTVSQELTDLVPGVRYALYVGVDNRSDGPATVSVESGGNTLARNRAPRSIARNYVQSYAHNTESPTVDGTSYFQNMFVHFTASDEPTVLTLGHSGEGAAYLDDVRVVENAYEGFAVTEDGSVLRLENDFEHNAQGIWPFVVGGSEGVEDNRVHLSEIHMPYTQAGWDVKRMDDVIDGSWSLKVNGLTELDAVVYRTIPQNVMFAPGMRYRIGFDYQSGSEGIYEVAVGDGESVEDVVERIPLSKSLGATRRCEFTFIGAEDGQSWFGIRSTDVAPDLEGTDGNEANFGGYRDIVIDNLLIERID